MDVDVIIGSFYTDKVNKFIKKMNFILRKLSF